MREVKTIGLDLAKNVFQLHGADKYGKTVFKRRLTRKKVIPFLVNIPECLVAMEACAGSNHWARQIRALGHEVRLIAPQFVNPYVKNDKTDENDAAAICEAATRPHMRFVPIKRVEQQDIQSIHRIRERLVKSKTALINEMRSILHEYGVIMPVGATKFRTHLPEVLAREDNDLTALTRELIEELSREYYGLLERIQFYDKKIDLIQKNHPEVKRLMTIPGVGRLGASAIIASVSDPHVFKNGREFAAWLGLVPKQSSSGGKQRMLGISKRGDDYIRRMLIHGSRASLRWMGDNRTGKRNNWAQGIKERRGFNRTAVALANKNARIVWALMAKQENYRNIA